MKKINLLSSPTANKPTNLAAVESTLLHGFPALIAHLAVTRYEDGDPRKPGWIQIRTSGAIWQCTAKDPDGAASLQATGQSVDDALALLELLLSAPDAPWEPDAYLMSIRPRGKKSG